MNNGIKVKQVGVTFTHGRHSSYSLKYSEVKFSCVFTRVSSTGQSESQISINADSKACGRFQIIKKSFRFETRMSFFFFFKRLAIQNERKKQTNTQTYSQTYSKGQRLKDDHKFRSNGLFFDVTLGWKSYLTLIHKWPLCFGIALLCS